MTEPLNRYYNMKMAVVDLSARSVDVYPLSANIVEEGIGGACANLKLFEEFQDENPMVLGVGPLTGSFAPASALMVATFVDTSANRFCHTPLLLRAGPELKFSGFDFVVIKGRSSDPQALLISNESIRVTSARDVVGMRLNEALAAFRAQRPHVYESIILNSFASDHHSPYAAICTETGGSLDKCGMAAWMSSRNLKTVVMNGTGGLPFESGHATVARRLRDRIFVQRRPDDSGCLAILTRVDPTWRKKRWLTKRIGKALACYNCPAPCMSYIELKGTPKGRENQKAGFVLLDHMGFLALLRKRGNQAPVLTNECFQLGLDPVAASAHLAGEDHTEQDLEILARLAETEDNDDKRMIFGKEFGKEGFPVKGLDGQVHRLFGGGIPLFVTDHGKENGRLWTRRVATAMILGICPLIVLLYPQLGEGALLPFLFEGKGDQESFQKTLDSCVGTILQKSFPLS